VDHHRRRHPGPDTAGHRDARLGLFERGGLALEKVVRLQLFGNIIALRQSDLS